MQLQPMKRSICLLLAMVMVFSMLPLQSFAAGTEDHVHAAEDADQALYQQLQSGCDRDKLIQVLLETYEVDAAEAAADVDAFLDKMRKLRILEDES